jgi:hypothetical protein
MDVARWCLTWTVFPRLGAGLGEHPLDDITLGPTLHRLTAAEQGRETSAKSCGSWGLACDAIPPAIASLEIYIQGQVAARFKSLRVLQVLRRKTRALRS